MELDEPLAEAGAAPLTVDQAIANLRHEDLSLRYYAAWWLGKFRVREAAAVEALILALQDDSDRTALGGYPLRRNAARALEKLDDRRAVPELVRCLDCEDFYVREAAAQALGALGDPVCIPNLLRLLEGGVTAAQLVPGRPHLVQPYEAVLEALGNLGATEATEAIQPFVEHPTPRVQYSAARAMYQLTQNSKYAERLVHSLQTGNVQSRRTILSDLGAIGYVPAAEAIASAGVENGFKILALKGLLESQLRLNCGELSDRAVQVMSLMDNLL